MDATPSPASPPPPGTGACGVHCLVLTAIAIKLWSTIVLKSKNYLREQKY